MQEEKLTELLNELAERTSEPVRPGLAEEIKQQIPPHPACHRGGMNTINIIIDLRVNRFAAAAVIILMLILFANFLGGGDSNGLYQDGKLVAKYLLADPRSQSADIAAGMLKYKHLVEQGREVVFYGDVIDLEDNNAVLMQWKLPGGNYAVMFGDLREKTVSAEELVRLQSQMLRNKAK